jgi:hypothetical protein
MEEERILYFATVHMNLYGAPKDLKHCILQRFI